VAFHCRNSIWLPVGILKLANGGGAAVLQNPNDKADALRQLQVCGVSDVVVDDDDAESCAFFAGHGIVAHGLRAFVSSVERPLFGDSAAAANEGLVIFSSGTTGLPKGVRLSHANVTAHLRLRLQVRTPLSPLLLAMPLFHIYGLVLCFQALMTRSQFVFLAQPYRVDGLMDVLERFRVVGAPLVTPIIRDLAQRSDLHRVSNTLRRIHNGGAALDHETIVRLRTLLPDTQQTQGYGMSETTGGFIYTDPTRPIRDDSIGHVLPEMETRISPEDGELFVRGPTVFVGYLPPGSDSGVDGEGWLATGDQLRRDAEGYHYIVGRKKEVFKVKGEQVSPTELEGVILRTCAEVADVAVRGAPHPRSGAVPVAHVVVRPGAILSDTELMARVAAVVAPFKRLDSVVFRCEAIPKTASGKIQRAKL
jgi:4-coumarate--CoA ligase